MLLVNTRKGLMYRCTDCRVITEASDADDHKCTIEKITLTVRIHSYQDAEDLKDSLTNLLCDYDWEVVE